MSTVVARVHPSCNRYLGILIFKLRPPPGVKAAPPAYTSGSQAIS